MKLRNKQLRSKEVSVKVQKKQSGAERMRKLREKKKQNKHFDNERQKKQEHERIANIRNRNGKEKIMKIF